MIKIYHEFDNCSEEIKELLDGNDFVIVADKDNRSLDIAGELNRRYEGFKIKEGVYVCGE